MNRSPKAMVISLAVAGATLALLVVQPLLAPLAIVVALVLESPRTDTPPSLMAAPGTP